MRIKCLQENDDFTTESLKTHPKPPASGLKQVTHRTASFYAAAAGRIPVGSDAGVPFQL